MYRDPLAGPIGLLAQSRPSVRQWSLTRDRMYITTARM